MPRTALTVQQIARDDGTNSELTPSYSAVDQANGNYFDISGQGAHFLHVKNDSGGNLTVTISTNVTRENITLPDKTYTVANGAEVMIQQVSSNFQQTDSGSGTTTAILLDWDTGTSVTAGVFRITTT